MNWILILVVTTSVGAFGGGGKVDMQQIEFTNKADCEEAGKRLRHDLERRQWTPHYVRTSCVQKR